jgi:hypothetical protein
MWPAIVHRLIVDPAQRIGTYAKRSPLAFGALLLFAATIGVLFLRSLAGAAPRWLVAALIAVVTWFLPVSGALLWLIYFIESLLPTTRQT